VNVKCNKKEIRQSPEDCVLGTVTICAPRWVVIGVSDREAKVEGTCEPLVTVVKSIQYDGGKEFTWKI